MSLIIALILGLLVSVVGRWAVLVLLAVSDWVQQRRAAIDPDDVEALTIVIPAWNEEAVIERTIRSALLSEGVELHVIVVDDGSSDQTAARVLAIEDPRLSLLQQGRNQGKAAALNRGLAAAETRVVLTLDADTLLAPDAARWLVATQRSTGAAAVAANVRVGNRAHLLTRWQSLEYVAGLNLDRRALHRLGLITTVPGAAALWLVAAVQQLGGFSGDTLAEDTDLTVSLLRAGHALGYQDRADAWTEAPSTPWGLWRQRRRWLTGNLSCLLKHRLGAGARPGVRWIALPNLWFAHVGVYLLPWGIAGLAMLVDPARIARPMALLGGVALCIDGVALLGAYLVDRADPWDLVHLPLQRLLYPWFVMGVFGSVIVRPPRSWASITRRNTALLG